MLLSELEAYVACLRSHVVNEGKKDVEVTFSLHRNYASALLQTSKHFMDVQPKPLSGHLRNYTGGAAGPNGEDSFRFIMPMTTVDISS